MKKYLLTILFAILLVWINAPGVASAQSVSQPPPNVPTSPVLITSYGVANEQIVYVQLYNNSSTLRHLEGWKLEWTIRPLDDGAQVTLEVPLSGWLLAHQYILVAQPAAVTGADIEVQFENVPPGVVTKLQIVPPEQLFSPYVTKANKFSPAGRYDMTKTDAGNYTTSRDFTLVTTPELPLYGGTLYEPPVTTKLQIVEVLVAPRRCSPAEAAVDPSCYDYVKLYNPTNTPILLDDYQLRTGWGNDSSGIGNTFTLQGTLPPGQFLPVYMRDDGKPFDLATSGGFAWLEDAMGIKSYTAGGQSWPDLGGERNRGFSWALNFATKRWGWGVPSPTSANNFSRQPAPAAAKTTTLKPCLPGQTRNPTTNRCRTNTAAATTYAPCLPGQARNPATNRCRSVLATTTSLKPCAPGQARNPDTNRCRKVTAAAASLPDVKDIEAVPDGNRYRWWITAAAAGLLVGAIAYGWRGDIAAWRARRGTKRTSS